MVMRLGEAIVERLLMVIDDTQPDYAVSQLPMARLKSRNLKHVNRPCGAGDAVEDQRVYGSRGVTMR
jgi:hypothetical protein